MTPVMLSARNGCKDVVLILAECKANLDLVDAVSVHVHVLNYKAQVSLFYIYPRYNKNLLLTQNY